MKKIFSAILNIGIHEGMPAYEQTRVQFVNFMELFCQVFYVVYFFMGFVFGSSFISVATLLMLVTGWAGFLLSHLGRHDLARSTFIATFCVLLFFVCNSVDVGFYFIPFFFPALLAFSLYYDLDHDFLNASVNLAICVGCTLLSVFLPQHLFFSDAVDPGWTIFIRNLNFTLAVLILLVFIFFTVFHIYKSGRQLVEAKEHAEQAVLVKSRFLSNMSHEMRTPLNGIIGTVNLLLQEPTREEQLQYYQVLKLSSEHMLKVINDVLDFSKIEAGKMELANESVNLKVTMGNLHTVFKNQFEAKKIAFEFLVDPQLDKYFVCDETRIRQVLTNLLGNAHKFTNEGRVCCEVKLLSATSQTAQVYFSVSDTGIGMEPGQQPLVFEAFNQGEQSIGRRYGGTGLGLTISKRIVEHLGGHLFMESKPGAGSHFYFTIDIPYCEKNKVMVSEKRLSDLPGLSGLRVLVAEDNPVNMTIARKFLQRWEVAVVEAANGAEAMNIFEQDARFDIVLLDLDMPVMDGYMTLDAIRSRNTSIPIIAFTAAVLPNMKEDLMARGFSDMLHKPFRPEDLHRKVAQFSGKHTEQVNKERKR